jgi:hypothetical protein
MLVTWVSLLLITSSRIRLSLVSITVKILPLALPVGESTRIYLVIK